MADSIFKRAQQAARAAVGVFTNDDPKRTWNLLTGVLPGGLGMPPARYARDFLRAYSQMPWLRAAANKIAMSVAQIDWKLYVKQGPDGKAIRDHKTQRAPADIRRSLIKSFIATDDMKEITDHPLLTLLNDANSFQTGLQMRKVTQLHIDLVGEAFWLKERDGLGNVVGVWPIPPDWVLNTPTPVNRFFRVQFRAWRGMIPDTEFLWFQDTDPVNPYSRGVGVAQSIADELETDEYTAKHTKAFFYNRAKPDLLIFPKQGTIRDPDIKRLETDWMQNNQGFWRAFKPYFMSREVGVHEMDQNFRAMQLVQLREFERDLIIQTFGIPPEMLGILTHSNRSTIDAASYLMGRFVLQPRLEFIRAVLQEKFIPEFDSRLIIEYSSPVDEDHATQQAAAGLFPWALNVNEQRHLAGLDPLDGDEGEVHLIPQGYTIGSLDDAQKMTQEQHAADIAPPPAPIIAPGVPPKPGAPKPPSPKPPKPAPPNVKPPKPGQPKDWMEDDDETAVGPPTRSRWRSLMR